MQRSYSLLVLGLSSFLSACANTPKPEPTPEPPAELQPSELFAESAAAVCAKATSCCTPIELADIFYLSIPKVTDEATCVDFLGGSFAAAMTAAVEQSVKSGRAAWDGEAAAACVAKIEAMSCDDYAAHVYAWGQTRSSDDLGCKALMGKVAIGGACAAHYECADGLCDGMAQGKMGTCAKKPVAGEACVGKMCAFGFYCEEGEDDVCRALKADGEACAADAECASNGCSGTHETAGVCGPATMCDADLGDDENDVYGSCGIGSNPGRGVDCKLSSTGWQCECLVDGEVVSTCEPDATGAEAPVCTTKSCCPS